MSHQELLNKSKFFQNFNKQELIKENLNNKYIKLNIACGPNIFPYPGWINIDREDLSDYFNHVRYAPLTGMPEHQQKVSNYLKAGGEIDFKIYDIRQGMINHNNDTVDFVSFGQTVEHLNPIYEVPKLLKEFNRILKPAGVLRITTPDLDLLINAYKEGKMEQFASEQPEFYKNANPSAQLAYLMFASCGPQSTYDNYEGHMFCYSKSSMTKVLKDAGFSEIIFYDKSGISFNKDLEHEIVDAGVNHSLIVEAIK